MGLTHTRSPLPAELRPTDAVLEASLRDLQARCQRLDASVVTVSHEVPVTYLHRALQRRLEALGRRARQ